jgi:hypothetical protein
MNPRSVRLRLLAGVVALAAGAAAWIVVALVLESTL